MGELKDRQYENSKKKYIKITRSEVGEAVNSAAATEMRANRHSVVGEEEGTGGRGPRWRLGGEIAASRLTDDHNKKHSAPPSDRLPLNVPSCRAKVLTLILNRSSRERGSRVEVVW